MNRTASGQSLPESLRSREFVNPWIFPWFAVTAFVIGVPGTLNRPTGSWFALACGIAICIGGATTMWLLLRQNKNVRMSTWMAVVSQIVFITAASFIVYTINPVDSFIAESSKPPPLIDIAVSTFLSASLSIVWVLTWVLMAILVAYQRAYRASRRLLDATADRLITASTRFGDEVLEPIRSLELSVARQLNTAADRLEKLRVNSTSSDALRIEVAHVRDSIVTFALTTLASISLDEDSTPKRVQRRRRRRDRKTNVVSRWNGQYFSGIVGALIIGIVSIASSTSVNVTSPGFFVQIPLIMIAFFLSVPSALFLFFAAALTPFLGPTSAASANYILFLVIVVLAVISFLQRANEVRQLRNLEGLTVANTNLALNFVSFRQEAYDAKKRITTVLHGRVQSSLVIAENYLNAGKPILGKDIERLIATLREASQELTSTAPTAQVDFATSISQVVSLWDGSMNVSVSVDQNASAILRHDSHAAATAIEVISEATVNAAKHASTSAVSATITAEGRRLRVAVINKRDLVDVSTNPVRSTFTGLAFLRELTSELRLESSESSTTLFAEIPSRVELDEFASGENATVSTFGVDPDAR